MAIVYLKDKNYEELIKEGKVLVDFYADWCGPCKMLTPVLEKFSNQRSDIKILEVDVDERSDLAQKFGILSIPTLFLYKDGELKSQKLGFQTMDMIDEWVNSI